jgi:hypothetical protein
MREEKPADKKAWEADQEDAAVHRLKSFLTIAFDITERRVGISGRAPNSLLRDSNSLLGIKFGSKIPCKTA